MWHDSDDEQLTVSLADNQRLRKLRVAEAEDVISGKEYIRRLRKQYQQLNPEPAWARPDLSKAEQGSSDEMDMDDEEEEQSTQPLAKLLQNATDLTRVEDNQGGKRKLRQEVLDIQRLKDVGKTQPVRVFHPFFAIYQSEQKLTKPVIYRLTCVPPALPRPPIVRTSSDTIPAPHLAISHSAQPAPHISPPTTHPHPHLQLRTAQREQDLGFRPPPLLPHLGPGHGQNRQSQWDSGPQRRAKDHGAVQAVPVRPVHRTGRVRTQRRRTD